MAKLSFSSLVAETATSGSDRRLAERGSVIECENEALLQMDKARTIVREVARLTCTVFLRVRFRICARGMHGAVRDPLPDENSVSQSQERNTEMKEALIRAMQEKNSGSYCSKIDHCFRSKLVSEVTDT